MGFESGKVLAGVGSILMAIGVFIPILLIIGLILLLVGLKELSDVYKDRGIFTNALYAVIAGIIGIAVVILIGIFAALGGILGVMIHHFGRMFIAPFSMGLALWALIALLLVFAISLVIVGLYLKRSFDILAAKSGEKLFGTVGLLILIGAVLVIVFGVGLLILFVTFIIAAVAFFALKPPTTSPLPEAQAVPV